MATGNTVSLQTDFNVDPYYDDFDETKNFHRVLFRPGLAVQGRELTQMQTIQQNQLDRFAEHIFKEGSVVRGSEINYDFGYSYVKVRDADAAVATVNAAAFVGTSVTGGTSGVTAVVVNSTDGSEANTPHTKTLYIKYTGSGSNNTTDRFQAGETLTANSGIAANVVSTAGAAGFGSAMSVGEGVIFAKDHFIRVDPQTLILEKYAANSSYSIGYFVQESVITESTDTTLLDPAQGSYNYTAPGAARLKLSAVLSKAVTGASSNANFVELVRTKNGVLQNRKDKPQYAAINDYIAQRTFDESGNYIVRGMNVRLREHLNTGNNQGVYTSGNGGNTSLLSAGVESGSAYVQGYNFENLVTRQVNVRKGLDAESINGTTVPSNYGNYVNVNEMVGVWDVNAQGLVSLRDTPANAVSNADFSTTTAVGAQIGTARVKAVEYSTGTKGSAEAAYKLYLYDVQMSSGAFTGVKSIYLNNASIADAKADLVLSANGQASVNEVSFNKSIFNINASSVKRLRDSGGTIDTNFKFVKKFDVTVATDGTFSIATGSADEQWPFSTGALNATQKRGAFTVVLNAAGNTTTTLSGTASILTGSNSVTGSGTAFAAELNIGDRVKFATYANTLTVSSISGATSMTVAETTAGAISSQAFTKEFEIGQVIDMAAVGSDAATRTVTINSGTSATFDVQETLNGTIAASAIVELNKVAGQEIAKTYRPDRYVIIDISSNGGSTAGPWNLGFADVLAIKEVRQKSGSTFSAASEGTDVTAQFTFDSGQTDNIYGHGKLRKKSTSGLTVGASDFLLIKLDYFTHDTSQGVGYLSVDSYPIDDVNTANTTAITTQEIPIHTSPVTGDAYRLRDCIDIRPRVTDTATSSTTVGSASTDPAVNTTIIEPSGGLHYSVPNEDFTFDFEYYLSRRDLVVLDGTGTFRIIEGQADLYPVTPAEPSDAMAISKIYVAPYPSLPPEISRRSNRPLMACRLTPVKNDRYTMRDIGALKDRIDRVEYYTSLSLLESEASSLLISDANGVDRFKNGILVDNFVGHNIGNVHDIDYAIAVDRKRNEMRPTFKLDAVEMQYSANSSNVRRAANDAVLTVGAGTYTNGESISVGSASGTLTYQVGSRLYLEQVVGTFSVSGSAVGGSSGTSSVVASVKTPSQGDLIVLPYTHTEIIDQPNASTIRNAAGGMYLWNGILNLTPDNDYWLDTTQRPDNQVNFDFVGDNWDQLSNSFGTDWNDWQTVWSGTQDLGIVEVTRGGAEGWVNLEATSITTERQTRSGIQTTAIPETQTQRTGSRLVDVNIIPFVRSRVIEMRAVGLKPSTKLYTYFDGEDVSSYVTPANSSMSNTGSEGSILTSDVGGNTYALLRIPNEDSLRFRTGVKPVRLTDSVTNDSTFGSTITSATTQYIAEGLSQTSQDTIISTRAPVVSTTAVSEEQTVTSRSSVAIGGGARFLGWNDGVDPIAQTFKMNDRSSSQINSPGTFVTKIDLFFQAKDANFPVTIQIREVDPSTQYITNRIVPFGSVTLAPGDINISEDGSAPTPVVFDSPVYLLNNQYYAIAVVPGAASPEYKLWISRLGETDLLTGNRITKQPDAGILFISANDSTWTAVQEEDLKFKLHVATFNTAITGSAILKNESRDMFSIANVSSAFSTIGEIVHGETTMTTSSSAGVNTGVYASGGTSLANGVVSSISGTTVRVKDITTAYKYANTETITFYHANGLTTGVTTQLNAQSTPSGKVTFYDAVTAANVYAHLDNSSGNFVANTFIKGQVNGQTARILSVDDIRIDTAYTNLGVMDLQGTTLTVSGKFATSSSTRDTSFVSLNLNDNSTFKASRNLLSTTNEVNGISSEKSAEIKGVMTTNNARHSPVIDLQKASLTTVQNLINNDSTGEANTSGGNATARYITRKVTLADGQDAEDMKVYLGAYKPSGSSIQVYYKIVHAEDSDGFIDRSWVLMDQVTSSNIISDAENTEDFVEYEYGILAAELSGSAGEVQYTNSQSVTFNGYKYFAIKVVLLSSDPAILPRVKDLRAIALQV